MNTHLLQQTNVLNIDEQIELVEAIWSNIASRGVAPSTTETQKTELDRRLTDYLAHPNDVIPWDEVKTAASYAASAYGVYPLIIYGDGVHYAVFAGSGDSPLHA